MKNRWRAIFVVTIAGFLFIVTGAPLDAARRVAKGSSYDGTWSVAIYTLRGDCGSLRAALRIVGGRVYSGDGSYQAYGGVGAGGAIRVTLVRGSQSASGSGRLSQFGCWALAYCWGRMFRHVVSVTVCGLLEQQPELVFVSNYSASHARLAPLTVHRSVVL